MASFTKQTFQILSLTIVQLLDAKNTCCSGLKNLDNCNRKDYERIFRTWNFLHKRPGCYHTASKAQIQIHAPVIYQIPWISEIHWISVPLGKTPMAILNLFLLTSSRLDPVNLHMTFDSIREVDWLNTTQTRSKRDFHNQYTLAEITSITKQ